MLDASIGAMMGSMIGFKQAAADGSFAVNETGGKALLAAIHEMAHWVDDNLQGLGILSRELPLGSSNGAQLMKPYVQNVATDEQGFITQLRQFRAALADAEQGVLAAMRNYQSEDGTSATGFQSV